MKTIKFRGWTKPEGIFLKTPSRPIYGTGYREYRLFGVKQVYAEGRWQDVERVDLFIATDAHGQDVYEGDLVRYSQVPHAVRKAVMDDQWLIRNEFVLKV